MGVSAKERIILSMRLSHSRAFPWRTALYHSSSYSLLCLSQIFTNGSPFTLTTFWCSKPDTMEPDTQKIYLETEAETSVSKGLKIRSAKYSYDTSWESETLKISFFLTRKRKTNISESIVTIRGINSLSRYSSCKTKGYENIYSLQNKIWIKI